MKNKKSNRKQNEDSSSDSDSSASDSSSSSSESHDSPPSPKKAKKDGKTAQKTDKSSKSRKRSEDEDYNAKKNSNNHQIESENVERANKRNAMEKSKWDSPQDKTDRREKKLGKHTRSDSTEKTDRIEKSQVEKKQEHHKDYQHGNRSDDRHRYDRERRYDDRDEKKDRYERSRSDYNDDNRNRRDHTSKRDDNEHQSRRYNHDRNSSDMRESKRDDRSHNSRKYGRDRSNSDDHRRNHSDTHQNKYRKRRHRSRSASLDHKDIKWGKDEDGKSNKTEKPKEKEKPNFSLSGKLTEETNTYRGVVIKYSEPPEARKPKRRWRLYPFKGEKALQTLYIHRESAYLIGRERKVVDLPVDHPSCSKQHAVLQYRLVPFTREDGSTGKRVRPYLIDLDSANGTFINNKKIESRKYVELLEKDVIKFGFSSREYVLLHENSKDEAQDDDVKEEEVYEPVKKEKD